MTRRILSPALTLLLCALAGATWAEPPRSAAVAPSPADATRSEIEHRVGFVPGFLKVLPDAALPGAWAEMKTLQISTDTALPCKIKELIGLAVASQIPCRYCTYSHTELAKLSGATQQEIGEAVVMAALARHWSTFMNGIQLSEQQFKKELDDLIVRLKSSSQTAPTAPPSPVVDAKSARAQVQQQFGALPEFLRRFPDVAVAGAWSEMRDVEMSPATALAGKHKSLISLAVAAQIPCKYCVYADTEFAKLEGASDAEIREAIAMASLTRHWSTVLDGLQVDEASYRKDIDRIVRSVKARKPESSARIEASKSQP
jgi:AhpD family alkylhydroperoxidase